MLGGEIKVVMSLDDGDFVMKTTKNGQVVSEMRKNLEKTGSAAKGFERHLHSLGSTFHDTIFTLSLLRFALHDIHDIFLGFPKAVMATTGEFERMTQLLSGMSKETEKAKREAEGLAGVKFVVGMAKNAPFEIKALTDSFVKFKSAGLDPANGSMQALVDSVARFGGNSDVLHRASIAIQQMAGKGVVSMEELRQQLGEAVPNAINLMAAGSGVSMAKLANEIKKGTVTATSALNNMFVAMSVENHKAAEDMMGTWTGMTAQISTQWELFKQEVGNAGFFQEVKNQATDLMGILTGNGAKSFAWEMGQGLKEVVTSIRSVVDWFVEWKGEIKLAGELFLVFFAADKFKKIADAMKNSGAATSFKSGVARIVDEAQANSKVLHDKAEFNRELLSQNEKAIADELSMAKAANTSKIALADQEIIAMRAKSVALRQEQQNELNSARNLNAQKNVLIAQANAVDLRSEAGRYQKRALLDEAEAKKVSVDQANKHAAALGREAVELNAETAALERHRMALANNNIVGTENTRILQEAQSNIRRTVSSLEEQATATAKVSFGTKALHGVMESGKMIWNAFGGWVGVAITVLTVLGDKLYEYLNRWKEFDQIVKQAKDGGFSEENIKKSGKLVAELDDKIAALQKRLSSRGGTQEMHTDATGAITYVDIRPQLEQELQDLLKQRKDVAASHAMQLENQEKDRHEREINVVKRGYEAAIDKENTAVKNIIAEKVKARDDAVAKAREAAGDKFNSADEEKIAKPFNDEIAARYKAFKKFELDQARQKSDEFRARRDAIKDTKSQEYKDADAAMSMFNTKVLDQAKKGWEMAADVGKLISQAKAPKMGVQHEHPLARMLADMEASIEIAKAKLQATINGVKDSELFKVQETFKILGEIESGKFDTHSKNNKGDTVTQKFGGTARSDYIRQFSQYLKDGGKDIDKFIDSLKGLDKNMVVPDTGGKKGIDAIKYLISGAGELEETKRKTEGLDAAQKKLAGTQEELNAATDFYNSQGLAKQIPALKSLLKFYDDQKLKLGEMTEEFKKYQDAKNQALANTIKSDALTYAGTQKEALKTATTTELNANDTISGAKERAFKNSIDQIEAEYKLKEATLLANVKDEEKVAEIKKFLDQGRTDAIKAAEKTRSVAMMTEMDKLKRTWSDTVEAMNGMTASWSRTFMDNIIAATTGGEVNWKAMVGNMAKDLAGVFLKKAMGDAVGNAMGGLSGFFGKAAGLGADKVDPAKAAETAAVTTAMTEMTASTSMAMGELATTSTLGMEEMSMTTALAMEGMTTATTLAMAEMTTAIVTAAATMSASSASSAAAGPLAMFAKNGAAFDGVSAFAKGGSFTNGTYNTPTLFKFGAGGKFGVMGEAGPEAVMPLSRDSSGRLGVSLHNGSEQSDAAGNTVSIQINVGTDGKSDTNSFGDDKKNWSTVADRIKAIVMKEVAMQKRPGGILYK